MHIRRFKRNLYLNLPHTPTLADWGYNLISRLLTQLKM